MKTLKITEEAWETIQIYKVYHKNKNVSEAIIQACKKAALNEVLNPETKEF